MFHLPQLLLSALTATLLVLQPAAIHGQSELLFVLG